MKMMMRAALFALLVVATPRVLTAQTVEIVYTPAVTAQALALKSVLKVDKVEAFSALALVGATADRKKAYADRVAAFSVLVVVGEDALRATSDVEFTCPVILVGAGGRTAAKNRVIRVFAASSPNAAVATAITSPASARFEVAKAGREVLLAGDVWPIVETLVASF